MRRPGPSLLLALAVGGVLAGCGTHRATSPLTVVVDGLADPRQMSFGADGALYVAEAGSGGRTACAKDPSTGGQICLGASGAIARVTGSALTRVVAGLPSVAATSGQEASGPADVVQAGGRLVVVVQDTKIDHTGANQFAASGLGKLFAGRRAVADLARFEATHNPDHGRGPRPPRRSRAIPTPWSPTATATRWSTPRPTTCSGSAPPAGSACSPSSPSRPCWRRPAPWPRRPGGSPSSRCPRRWPSAPTAPSTSAS